MVDDHRPGFVLPGFVDTHIHFPQTFAGDSYGGGQLLEWLERCIFPSESRLADPSSGSWSRLSSTAAGPRRYHCRDGVGSAFPHAQDALFEETQRRGLRIVSGRGIQTRGPDSAGPLLTSEEQAIDLTAAEIGKWHAADTGDVETALLHVALVPRFSFSVTTEDVGSAR